MLQTVFDAAIVIWPAALALAWIAGELLFHRIGVPRVATYSIIGFVLSQFQFGALPRLDDGPVILLAQIAMGLALFEFGFRVNLNWLRHNPWIAAEGMVIALGTFAAVYAVSSALGMPTLSALLLASLALCTSPVELVRVLNEQRSSGQVTERSLHMAAINCFVAVYAFNLMIGLWTFETSGDLSQAVTNSLVVLIISTALGVLFGALLPSLLAIPQVNRDHHTIVFALGVILLVALAYVLKVSPIVAAMTFGVVARHRRVTYGRAARSFGALGDLLAVMLFVFIGAAVSWGQVIAGVHVAAAVVIVRFAAQSLLACVFARSSGTSLRKGVLTGVAMSPMSAMVVMLVLQKRQIGLDLLDQVAPLSAITLAAVLLGPLLAQTAIRLSGETSNVKE